MAAEGGEEGMPLVGERMGMEEGAMVVLVVVGLAVDLEGDGEGIEGIETVEVEEEVVVCRWGSGDEGRGCRMWATGEAIEGGDGEGGIMMLGRR